MNLSGNECWTVSVNGQSGTGMLVTVDDIRAGVGGTILLNVTSGLVQAIPTVSSYFLTSVLTGALSIMTPPDASDGMLIIIVNASGISFTQTITLTQSPGQTVRDGNLTNIPAGTSGQWQYVSSQKTWFKVR